MEQPRRRSGRIERHDEARDAFVQALAIDAQWIPALYNLGLLHEEFGERDIALERFERVLAIDPEHHDAFVRVVHASVGRGDGAALVDRVRLRLQTADLLPVAREALSFALGDALDALSVATTTRLPRTRRATRSRAAVRNRTIASPTSATSRSSQPGSARRGCPRRQSSRQPRWCSSAACGAAARRCSSACSAAIPR